LRDEEKRNIKKPPSKRKKGDELWRMDFTRNKAWRMEMAILKFPGATVGDIPNRYTSNVVLNQQARVTHPGGMADCLPGGSVAGKTMTVLDAGAHGGSADKPMAGCLVVHA
jgi:hypothetical protein